MTTFKGQLDKAYQKKVIKTLETAVRSVAFVVDAELVNNTPVRTGRAKNNWLPSLNTPNRHVLAPNEPRNVDGVFASFNINDTILITNNLDYIRKLNDGSSIQAPKGFVDDAVQVGRNALK